MFKNDVYFAHHEALPEAALFGDEHLYSHAVERVQCSDPSCQRTLRHRRTNETGMVCMGHRLCLACDCYRNYGAGNNQVYYQQGS